MPGEAEAQALRPATRGASGASRRSVEPAARQRGVGHLEGHRARAPHQREKRPHDRDEARAGTRRAPRRGSRTRRAATGASPNRRPRAAVGRRAAHARLDAARELVEERRRRAAGRGRARGRPRPRSWPSTAAGSPAARPTRVPPGRGAEARLDARARGRAPSTAPSSEQRDGHDAGRTASGHSRGSAQEEDEAGGHVPRAGGGAPHEPRAGVARTARPPLRHGPTSLAESFAP